MMIRATGLGALLAVLACSNAAFAPDMRMVGVLPLRNIVQHVNGERSMIWGAIAPPDIWAEVTLFEVKQSVKQRCEWPRYVSEDHLSARDVMYQQCETSHEFILLGELQLRHGTSNILYVQTPLSGRSIARIPKVKIDGDVWLVPQHIGVQPAARKSDFSALYQAALADLTTHRDALIRHYLGDQSAIISVIESR